MTYKQLWATHTMSIMVTIQPLAGSGSSASATAKQVLLTCGSTEQKEQSMQAGKEGKLQGHEFSTCVTLTKRVRRMSCMVHVNGKRVCFSPLMRQANMRYQLREQKQLACNEPGTVHEVGKQ
jgi:hypothetical protein